MTNRERIERNMARIERNRSKVVPMTAGELIPVGPLELAPRDEVYGPVPRLDRNPIANEEAE